MPNFTDILSDMATNMGSMPVNEKLNGTNYNIWCLKVQFLLNNGDMVEFLRAFMFALAEWDKHNNDVIASELYQEKLKAYET